MEVAASRGLAVSTVEGHLVEAMEAREQIDLARLVPSERRRAIESAFAETGTERLKPAMKTSRGGVLLQRAEVRAGNPRKG